MNGYLDWAVEERRRRQAALEYQDAAEHLIVIEQLIAVNGKNYEKFRKPAQEFFQETLAKYHEVFGQYPPAVLTDSCLQKYMPAQNNLRQDTEEREKYIFPSSRESHE